MTTPPTTTGPLPPLGWRPRRWWIDIVIVVLLGAFVLGLIQGLKTPTWVIDVDLAFRDWSDAHRPHWMYLVARLVNFLGQGTPLAILAAVSAILLARKWRSIRPLLVYVALYFAVGSVIKALKVWSDRVGPHHGPGDLPLGPPYPDAAHAVFFTGGQSFPSGHAVNTIVSYAMLLTFCTPLIRRLADRRLRLLVRIGPPVLVTWSMTYLSWHWFSEALAGVALGIIIERVVFRVPWERVPLPWLGRFEGTRSVEPGSSGSSGSSGGAGLSTTG